MPKITKRTVDALEPRDREHVLWDDEIIGFVKYNLIHSVIPAGPSPGPMMRGRGDASQ